MLVVNGSSSDALRLDHVRTGPRGSSSRRRHSQEIPQHPSQARPHLQAAAALATFEHERDRLARDVFEITCALSAYPDHGRFLQLQKQLALAIDVMAGEMAAKPLPRVSEVAA